MVASTEPRSFEHGVVIYLQPQNSLRWLQRSRALSSTEWRAAFLAARHRRNASTEPRSFEHGVLIPDDSPELCKVASTEPRSFEHGVHRLHGLLQSDDCGFNGAALFRARSAAGQGGTGGHSDSFNGAALFRARSGALGKLGKQLNAQASTEPRSFEHGVFSACRQTAFRKCASTEPRSFEHGVASTKGQQIINLVASTEPRSFEHGVPPHFLLAGILVLRFNGAALFRARSGF